MRLVKRSCEQCGADISARHYHARFCFPCVAERAKTHAALNPKTARHAAVREITKTAVRVGFLPAPNSLHCVDCGKAAECYDHRDYNRPLYVEPVCLSCNCRRGPGKPLLRDLVHHKAA